MNQPLARLALLLACSNAVTLRADEPARSPLKVPTGFSVARVAGTPLVERPLFAALADDGTLYVLDSGGVNGSDRGQKPPDVIRCLKDEDGDGVYDKSTIYADKIVFGTGLVWYDGALFVTSPPSLWKLADTDGDGVCDQRRELVTGFAFNQSCSDDVHGACLGPDGRIYFLPGRFPHKVRVPGGAVLREAVGPWLMRCRADGSEIEFVSGAVGNPVEVTFLPDGEAFVQGTFWAKPSAGRGLRDAVVQIVEGGEYSVRDRDYKDRTRTGDFLPALVELTATAPSGLTAYRGRAWGENYEENVFGSHFNTGKILRYKLRSSGAAYDAAVEDFITARGDVHFTDVMQDADGSLLAIDTGGWFRACCPASGVAKPDVYGALYRVTKDGAPRAKDPYGNEIHWAKLPAADLVARLDDPRFHVQERAIEALRKLGQPAIDPLAKVLAAKESSETKKLSATWALCRVSDEAARGAGRAGLSDASPRVRQAAVRAAALHRDAGAYDAMLKMLKEDVSPAVRREAANAIGRIGRAEAAPELLEAVGALSSGLKHREFAEHALVLALTRVGDADAARAGLKSELPAVRRAALVALDQMPEGKLQPTEVVALSNAPHAALRQAAGEVLRRHPEWSEASVAYLGELLKKEELSPTEIDAVIGTVRALQGNKSLHALVELSLTREAEASVVGQQTLLRALATSGERDVPQPWRVGIAAALHAKEESVRIAALSAAGSLQLKTLSPALHDVVADTKRANVERAAALRGLAQLKVDFTDTEFRFLLPLLSPQAAFQDRLAAVDAIRQAKFSNERLQHLARLIDKAGPVELPYLLAAFEGNDDGATGQLLVSALQRSTVSPAPQLVARAIEHYPESVKIAANPLLARLEEAAGKQTEKLDAWEAKLKNHTGDAARGRELFFAKASCHLCHTAEGRGGSVGPNLSGIGAIRKRRELLEAIVFPSLTFARGYEPVNVELKDGRVLSGMMGRESADEIAINTVQDNKPVEVRLRRSEIEELRQGLISTMPNGLDAPLSPAELGDLLEYLQSLKGE